MGEVLPPVIDAVGIAEVGVFDGDDHGQSVECRDGSRLVTRAGSLGGDAEIHQRSLEFDVRSIFGNDQAGLVADLVAQGFRQVQV